MFVNPLLRSCMPHYPKCSLLLSINYNILVEVVTTPIISDYIKPHLRSLLPLFPPNTPTFSPILAPPVVNTPLPFNACFVPYRLGVWAPYQPLISNHNVPTPLPV